MYFIFIYGHNFFQHCGLFYIYYITLTNVNYSCLTQKQHYFIFFYKFISKAMRKSYGHCKHFFRRHQYMCRIYSHTKYNNTYRRVYFVLLILDCRALYTSSSYYTILKVFVVVVEHLHIIILQNQCFLLFLV